PGATNNVYSIASTHAPDAGTYAVSAGNFVGTNTSAPATLTVRDMMPPTLNCPGNFTVKAPTKAGTTVNYTVTGSDSCDPNAMPICNPPSGTFLTPGIYTVNCSITDAGSNSVSCSFVVNVQIGETYNFSVNTDIPDGNFNGLAS